MEKPLDLLTQFRRRRRLCGFDEIALLSRQIKDLLRDKHSIRLESAMLLLSHFTWKFMNI